MKALSFLLILISSLLSACGAFDESSDSKDSTGSTPAPKLTGLWFGETQEQGATAALDTKLLFFKDKVFILREDEAQIGSYMVENNGRATLDIEVYSYNAPDTDNQFYVGTRTSNRINMDALFATSEDIFINFDGSSRSGSITLTIDSQRSSSLDLNRIRGTWGTQDAILYINDEGGLQGSNSATGCQWKGKLMSTGNDFLALEVERKLCADFNQPIGSPAMGFAFLDGEGILHFIAEEGSEFLWMQFESSTTTASAPAI